MADEIIVRIRAEGQKEFIDGMKKAGVTAEKTGDKIEKENEDIAKSNKKLGGSYKKLGLAIAGAFSVAALGRFLKATTKLADVQQKAEIKLLTALKGREDVQQRLIKQASALQKETLFGDEATINAQALLASLGLNEEAITRLIPLVQDLATKSGMDLSSTADLIAKSVGSSTNALSRYGVVITGAVGSSDRLESAIKSLNDQVGGQAAAAAQVGLGAWTQLGNIIGDIKEVIGGFVLNALDPLARGLIRLLGPTESSTEALIKQNKAFENQETQLQPLLGRYDELKEKTTLSAAEQDELKVIVNDIVQIMPGVASGFDDYGEALDINRGSVENFIDKQRELNLLLNEDEIRKVEKAIAKLEGRFSDNADAIDAANRAVFDLNDNIFETENAAEGVLEDYNKEAQNLGESNKLVNVEIARQLLLLESLGKVLSDGQKEFIKLTLAAENLVDTGDGGRITAGILTGFALLKKQITEAQKAIDSIDPTLDPNGFNTAVQQLQALIDKLGELEQAGFDAVIGENVAATLNKITEDVDVSSVFNEIENDLITLEEGVAKDAQDAVNQARQEGREADAAAELALAKETASERRQIAAISLSGIASFAQEISNFRTALAERELQALQTKLDQGLISEKEFEKERAEIQRKQAQQQKANAIFTAIVNGAAGIVSQFQAGPAGFALAAVAAALTAAQIAVIAAQPIPQFAKGTRHAPAGMAWVGEEGPELIQMKGGEKVITNNDSEQLMKILGGYGIPVQFKSTYEELYKPMSAISEISDTANELGIDFKPLINTSERQRLSLGKKLDKIHMALISQQGHRMTKA